MEQSILHCPVIKTQYSSVGLGSVLHNMVTVTDGCTGHIPDCQGFFVRGRRAGDPAPGLSSFINRVSY